MKEVIITLTVQERDILLGFLMGIRMFLPNSWEKRLDPVVEKIKKTC